MRNSEQVYNSQLNECSQSSNISVCSDFIEDEDISDEDLMKIAQKRKSTESVQSRAKVAKGKKDRKTRSSENSDFTQEEGSSSYTLAQIQTFLQDTEGLRLLKVENFFPDLKLFVSSAQPLTRASGGFGDEGLTEQEIYRLRKLIIKVKAQIIGDDV